MKEKLTLNTPQVFLQFNLLLPLRLIHHPLLLILASSGAAILLGPAQVVPSTLCSLVGDEEEEVNLRLEVRLSLLGRPSRYIFMGVLGGDDLLKTGIFSVRPGEEGGGR